MRPQHPEKVHAPYNFVPLSGWIYQPDWADQVSQDVPFSDGINGTLKIRIKAHSPILVGGEQKASDGNTPGSVMPFQTADGTFAIPGSSLKGMIRSLMSIVSFGKMRQVEDKWLSIRDLTPGARRIYRDRITNPGPNAGYLRPVKDGDGFKWKIVPCKYLRVTHETLEILGKRLDIKEYKKIREEQKAPSKYKVWKEHLNVTFSNPDPEQGEDAYGLNRNGNQKKGRLVFTGQPSENDNSKGVKKRDFIFFDSDEGDSLSIKPEVIRAFFHIHEETDEWKFHIKNVDRQIGIPVFYLAREKEPTEIGLALMFRLPYSNSIGAAVDRTHPGHRDSATRDLADLVFGHINENESGMAGRVSFSMAHLKGTTPPTESLTAILSNPKPSYYPSYITQKHKACGRLDGDSYKTLMDEVEIRGWKRYPARAHGKIDNPDVRKINNNSVKVKLHPLPSGSTFEACIRLHNIRPMEFGALLWCLTWGGDAKLRHGLGMGKPLGMGIVSCEIDNSTWQLNRNDGGIITDASSFIKLFESEMEQHFREAVLQHHAKKDGHWYEQQQIYWYDSEQMVQLRAMANPACVAGEPGKLTYMELKAHLQGKKHKQVLLPYTQFKGTSDQELFKERSPSQRKALAKRLKQEQEAREAEKRRQAALAELPTLQREVLNDLHQEGNTDKGEGRAKHWIAEMQTREPEEAVQVARALVTFFRKEGKWDGKQSKKQQTKIAKIKKVLSQAGGSDVPK